MAIDVNTAVKTMLKMLQRLIGENIELSWQPAESPCTVKMDPSQLDQILVNLCVNAREAIEDVGRITIDTARVLMDEAASKAHADCCPGDYVRLSVLDNGTGMDRETADRVFEPFFTTKGVGRGTGWGSPRYMALSNRARGLSISAANRELERHSIFIFHFMRRKRHRNRFRPLKPSPTTRVKLF